MDMHISQARHQIFSGAVDFDNTFRYLHLRFFSYFLDDLVLGDNRHSLQDHIARHRNKVDIDKGVDRRFAFNWSYLVLLLSTAIHKQKKQRNKDYADGPLLFCRFVHSLLLLFHSIKRWLIHYFRLSSKCKDSIFTGSKILPSFITK